MFPASNHHLALTWLELILDMQMAISIASADVDFAQKIAEMLEQVSYIDECDTLGQKTNRQDIHKASIP